MSASPPPSQQVSRSRYPRGWKQWLGGALLVGFLCALMSQLVGFARSVPTLAHALAAIAVLFFLLDIWLTLRGRSSVFFISACVSAIALFSNISNLLLALLLTSFAVAVNVGVPVWISRHVRTPN